VFGPKTGVFLLLATLTNVAVTSSSSTTSAVTSSSTTSATSSSTTSVPVQAHAKVSKSPSSPQEQVLEPSCPVSTYSGPVPSTESSVPVPSVYSGSSPSTAGSTSSPSVSL
jgi:hypothetical protein